MKKRMVLVAAAVAMLSVGASVGFGRVPSALAARAATVMRTSGPEAATEFDDFDIGVTVLVNVATGTTQVPPSGETVTGPVVVVNMFTSSPSPEWFAAGHALAPGLTIDGNKLSGATLPLTTVTVTVQDSHTNTIPVGTTFPVEVAVTWTGTGPVVFFHGTSHFRTAGEIQMSHQGGKFRDAIAVANTLTFTPPDGPFVDLTGQENLGGLSNGRSIFITIMH